MALEIFIYLVVRHYRKILLLFNVKFSKFTNKQNKQYPRYCNFEGTGFKKITRLSLFWLGKFIIREFFLYFLIRYNVNISRR